MPEYIERENAIKKVMETKWESGSDGAAAMEIVAAIPAAAVAPVVHGWWVSDEADVLFHCSECWTQISTSWDYDDLRWNYCPNCGAKMDGGAGDE